MSKAIIIKTLMERTGISKSKAEDVYDVFVDKVVSECAYREGSIRVPGLGTFSTVLRQAKKGRNPKTGEEVVIPERKGVKFKPHKFFTDKLAGL